MESIELNFIKKSSPLKLGEVKKSIISMFNQIQNGKYQIDTYHKTNSISLNIHGISPLYTQLYNLRRNYLEIFECIIQIYIPYYIEDSIKLSIKKDEIEIYFNIINDSEDLIFLLDEY